MFVAVCSRAAVEHWEDGAGGPNDEFPGAFANEPLLFKHTDVFEKRVGGCRGLQGWAVVVAGVRGTAGGGGYGEVDLVRLEEGENAGEGEAEVGDEGLDEFLAAVGHKHDAGFLQGLDYGKGSRFIARETIQSGPFVELQLDR